MNQQTKENRGFAVLRGVLTVLVCLLVPKEFAFAARLDVDDGRQLFISGQYAKCAEMAEKALEDYGSKEDWQLLLTRSLLAQGKYEAARRLITNALTRNSWSVRLRWQAREVLLANGQTREAAKMLDEVIDTVSSQPRSYRDPEDMLVFGQAALLKGADPKRVMDTLYDTARKAAPKLRDVYLVAGQLALDKHDYALAAKKFEEGLKQLPEDPDLHFGLARAYAPSDPELTLSALEATLERNSNHVGGLLLLVDRMVDAEDYEQADKFLDQVQRVNPAHPESWAYRAVLAHFRNQPEEEKTARQAALKHWATNPQVDHLIGLKLSQHYRFAEGAALQRQALEFDPDFLPAKAQLAQDLLRLGEEIEGWALVEEVQRQDAYDVETYNLATLRDSMAKFTTLTNEHFVVRMGKHEAAVYGSRVLELLNAARETVCAKYGINLTNDTLVEIFPEQKDFAVRTFGMPGNPGYLGVCFGKVITANSPVSQGGGKVNWEAVLWHEFTHVVTLQMTKNKMPRWLSEGISVHEELEANPAWGQKMEPRYREMILAGELTPVSKLSGAFLAPETDLHLQFAYYESALVVEFLVKRFGIEKLVGILKSLGEGTEINAAIEKHTAPMPLLEREFGSFAKERAQNLAPGLDWDRPDSDDSGAAQSGRKKTGDQRVKVTDVLMNQARQTSWEDWAKSRPTNFWVMTRKAAELVDESNWAEAKPILTQLVELYPDFTGGDSAYRMLAAAHRALGETNLEWDVLTRFAEKDDEATDAYARLMELAAEKEDWQTVILNAERYLAVNPLVAEPYRFLAEATEAVNDLPAAIASRRALLELDPPDPAAAHFSLAQLLYQTGKREARYHLLQALEEAPRYQPALRLLLKMKRNPSVFDSGEPSS